MFSLLHAHDSPVGEQNVHRSLPNSEGDENAVPQPSVNTVNASPLRPLLRSVPIQLKVSFVATIGPPADGIHCEIHAVMVASSHN